MNTTIQGKLKGLYTKLPAGAPVTSAQLAEMGISADLAVHYVRSGWLKRLARGVFSRPNEPLLIYPSLLVLQRQVAGLHVGGKTALDWHGVRQYVTQQPILHLYGWDTARLPDWFTRNFPSEYHRKRLFDETPEKMLYVTPYEKRENAPLVSVPERALLEVLDEVGVRQPLQEAKEILESAHGMRADILMELLTHCTSVKTVRLCLTLSRELSLPWATKLKPELLPKGGKRPWISNTKDGLLVLKP